MKYGVLFGVLSTLFIGAAFRYPAAAIVFLWLAACFIWVALGYLGLVSSVFGKSADGRIHHVAKVFLLPFFLYTWCVWHIFRVFSRENAYDRVDEDLVVGRRLLAREELTRVDHYVDLTSEMEEPKKIRQHSGYFCFPILDASTPTEESLACAVNTVLDGQTYIHCAQGHGRTGLFALGLLIHKGQITSVEEGLALLNSRRPGISLNKGQLKFMEQYLAHFQNSRDQQCDSK